MSANPGFLSLVLACAVLSGCTAQGSLDANASPITASADRMVRSGQDDDPRCDAHGDCKIALDGVSGATEACDGSSPNLYWKQGNPSLLLSCECDCTSHDNKGWLVHSNRKNIQGLVLGKPATSESIRGIEFVRDIVASHPFCSGIDHGKLDGSGFITLIKYPTGNDASPYCFDVRTIVEADGDVDVSENGRPLDDADAFFETNPDDRMRILDLVNSLPGLPSP